MMDLVLKYKDMTKDQLEDIAKDKTLTVLELLMIKYVTSGFKDNKMLMDMMNRHVPYAPTKTEITGEDGNAIKIIKI
jgi:hypothetical protein